MTSNSGYRRVKCKYCQNTYCSDSYLISAYKKLVKALDELCEARRNSGCGKGVILQVMSVKSCRDKIDILENQEK
jgi:hypothetical protein